MSIGGCFPELVFIFSISQVVIANFDCFSNLGFAVLSPMFVNIFMGIMNQLAIQNIRSL